MQIYEKSKVYSNSYTIRITFHRDGNGGSILSDYLRILFWIVYNKESFSLT